MKKKLIIGGVILCVALGYLIYTFANDSMKYYVTVSELLDNGSSKYGKSIRVAGTVEENSIVWDSRLPELKFVIADSGAILPVTYKHALPDNFAAGKDIVVEGEYNPDKTFHADKIVQKCPSKYVPQK